MEFLGTEVSGVAHESVSDAMLLEKGIKRPDFLPTIMRLWPDEAPLIQLLDIKGQKTKGLHHGTNDANYRVVGSNHVQYPIETSKSRMDTWTEGPGNKVFVDDFHPDQPGYGGSIVTAWANGNWAGYQEVIEMADGTLGYVLYDPELDTNNAFKYKIKVFGRQDGTEYFDPSNFEQGAEFKAQMNAHEQDWSERGTEKYQFDAWGDAYLTLQRFKYSYSGTAKATTSMSGYWTMHNGQETFLEKQEALMMKRAAEYLNWQLIWGKSTVSTQGKTKVTLTNDKGRDVLAGNGIMNANGGALKMPINNGWSRSFIDTLLADMDPYVQPDHQGVREVAILMTHKNYLSFQRAMGEMGKTMDSNIEGSGDQKGINDTYKYYEIAGIRLIPKRWKALDPQNRPGKRLSDGSKSNEWDAIAVPMGNTPNGNKGLELIQLRPSVGGTVAGIDQGGNIASSVDGTSHHKLFQNGIVSHITPFYIKRDGM